MIGGGGDVMPSILGSHFIRLMEGMDHSPFVPVREYVSVCVLPLMAASKAKVVMKTKAI